MSNFYSNAFFASLIAGGGLIMNSPSCVMSSMLVSPYLEPIMGMANGNPQSVLTFGGGGLIAIIVGYIMNKYFKPKETQTMQGISGWKKYLSINLMIPIICGLLLAYTYDPVTLVGIGLAISILPPLVTAGMYIEQNDLKKTKESIQLSLLNLTLLIVGYLLMKQVRPLVNLL